MDQFGTSVDELIEPAARSSATAERVLELVREVTAAEGREFVHAVLEGVRDFLDMDVAFIGEFTEDSRVFRYVESRNSECPIRPDTADALEDSYCQRVIDGRLPELITDATLIPAAAELAATLDMPIGAHLSIPIRLSDGSIYGTFCTFAHQPNLDLQNRDLDVMRLLASLIVNHLENERRVRLTAESEIDQVRDVIEHTRLRAVFQPIVDLLTDEVVGYEALTRFAVGSPTDWFDRAARADLATDLELTAVQEALRHIGDLPDRCYLAVNVSPSTLCSAEFAAAAQHMPLEQMVIELTEQSSVASYPDLVARANWLRSRGARIAIDDAGTGYAGLQRILAVAPDIVKLDRQLISGIDIDEIRQSLASAMSWFTSRSGNRLVAEGIETLEERTTLVALGIRYGQGFHLGRPAPLPTVHDHVVVPPQREGTRGPHLRPLPNSANSRIGQHPAGAKRRPVNLPATMKWLA